MRLRAIVLVLDAGALKQQRLVRLRLEISGIAPVKGDASRSWAHLHLGKIYEDVLIFFSNFVELIVDVNGALHVQAS